MTSGRLALTMQIKVLQPGDDGGAMRLYAATGGIEASTDQVMFTFPLGSGGSSRQ